MNFLIARPSGKAQITTNAFIKAGYSATALPLIDVSIYQQETLYAQLALSETYAVIVTSTYAADWLINYFKLRRSSRGFSKAPKCKQMVTVMQAELHVKFICVGKATATRLNGWVSEPQIIIAKPENSDGILALECLKEVAKRTIVLLKGEGGRELIANTLNKRRANLCELKVYRRTVNQQVLNTFSVEPQIFTCIIATSIEIVDALLSKFDNIMLNKMNWIVPSKRIKEHAMQKGIMHISVSTGARESELVQSAKRLFQCQKQAKRN